MCLPVIFHPEHSSNLCWILQGIGNQTMISIRTLHGTGVSRNCVGTACTYLVFYLRNPHVPIKHHLIVWFHPWVWYWRHWAIGIVLAARWSCSELNPSSCKLMASFPFLTPVVLCRSYSASLALAMNFLLALRGCSGENNRYYVNQEAMTWKCK